MDASHDSEKQIKPMNEGFKLLVISSRRKEIKARVNYRKNLPKGGLAHNWEKVDTIASVAENYLLIVIFLLLLGQIGLDEPPAK